MSFTIKSGGIGGFLNPPGDAEHHFHVEDSRSTLSLRYALEQYYVSKPLKESIRDILKMYKCVFTEEWEHSVYNYFRNCYAPEDGDVSKCIIDNKNSLPNERHLGYLHIKSFFPEYKPNQTLILHNGNKGNWSKEKK